MHWLTRFVYFSLTISQIYHSLFQSESVSKYLATVGCKNIRNYFYYKKGFPLTFTTCCFQMLTLHIIPTFLLLKWGQLDSRRKPRSSSRWSGQPLVYPISWTTPWFSCGCRRKAADKLSRSPQSPVFLFPNFTKNTLGNTIRAEQRFLICVIYSLIFICPECDSQGIFCKVGKHFLPLLSPCRFWTQTKRQSLSMASKFWSILHKVWYLIVSFP